jgi:hypothetical protein
MVSRTTSSAAHPLRLPVLGTPAGVSVLLPIFVLPLAWRGGIATPTNSSIRSNTMQCYLQNPYTPLYTKIPRLACSLLKQTACQIRGYTFLCRVSGWHVSCISKLHANTPRGLARFLHQASGVGFPLRGPPPCGVLPQVPRVREGEPSCAYR